MAATAVKTDAEIIEEQGKEIERLKGLLDKKEGEVKALCGKVDELESSPYTLRLVSEKAQCSRYDGLPDGQFVWHEAIGFACDMGYDLTVLFERASGSLRRCFGEDPTGQANGRNVYRDFGQGDDMSPGGRGFVPSGLPAFDPNNALEIIVRIVPKT